MDKVPYRGPFILRKIYGEVFASFAQKDLKAFMRKNLPSELKLLVRQTLALLGDEIKNEFGAASYKNIEAIRREMASLRALKLDKSVPVLSRLRQSLKSVSLEERHRVAQSFTLMMELMNACENAYRSYRLVGQDLEPKLEGAEEIIFVVTAHPTESRFTATIPVIKKVQRLLKAAMEAGFESVREELSVHIRLLLRLPLAPSVAPTPEDEAEHLYRWILEPELLDTILDRPSLRRRVRFRAWSGGDKDGHPGIDERVMLNSLGLSRRGILNYLRLTLAEVETLLRGAVFFDKELWGTFFERLDAIETVEAGDFTRCLAIQDDLSHEVKRLSESLGFDLAPLRRLEGVRELFPAWVVPLELRESGDIIESVCAAKNIKHSEEAIVRMLRTLGTISDATRIRGYVQSWVISMVRDARDLAYAEHIQRALWNEIRLPIVPLFENRAALETAPHIVETFLKQSDEYCEAVISKWRNRYEVMLGYSDSSKESGVLASRFFVAGAMQKLEALFMEKKITPVFFHGTGGSVARGGGTIEEQMAVWTPGARRFYKVTVQGEMVARTFASPEQFLRHLQNIDRSSRSLLQKKLSLKALNPALEHLALANAKNYVATIESPEFLARVERATIYPFLHTLKIGSRPAKRKGLSKVSDLRAIPWVLCWNQNRVLFPNWWGLVDAWDTMSAKDKAQLTKLAKSDPLWSTYLKQLGFSLAKIDFAPWFAQLERLGKDDPSLLEWEADFARTFQRTRRLLAKLIGSGEMLWFRPWLKESIHLRRTMIYPLDILQNIAEEESDEMLLRLTVTGIASGMLTSG